LALRVGEKTVRKLIGIILVTLGLLFFAAAAFSGLVNVPISVIVLVKGSGGSTGYMIGRLVGAVFATVLFFLLGRKSFKAGRSRFAPVAADERRR
jgi:hypothetical protein